MNLPTQLQSNAILGHVATFGGGAVAVFTFLGAIDAETAKSAIAAIKETIDGLQQAIGGVSKLAFLLGPALGATMALFAGRRVSIKSQVQAVQTAEPQVVAKAMSEVAPAEVVKIVDAMPDVAGVVTKSTIEGVALAKAVPSITVAPEGTIAASTIANK